MQGRFNVRQPINLVFPFGVLKVNLCAFFLLNSNKITETEQKGLNLTRTKGVREETSITGDFNKYSEE